MVPPVTIPRAVHRDWAKTVSDLDAIGFDIGHTHISVWRVILFLVVAAAVLVAGSVGTFVIRRVLRRARRLDPAQQVLAEKLVSIGLWLLLILMAIDTLGISLTSLAVFSGALGLAIGFGLQKTFGNLLAGIILLGDRSIKPGDVIAVGEGARRTVGQVNRIGIRAVSVITRDRIEFLIPNEVLMTATVENWSFSSRDVRVKIPVSVAYGADLARAEAIMLEVARALPRHLETYPPAVWMTAFGDNGIEYEVQIWIDDPEEGVGNLRSDYLKALWRAFAQGGIAVPFPQREVRVIGWPAGPAAPGPDSSA